MTELHYERWISFKFKKLAHFELMLKISNESAGDNYFIRVRKDFKSHEYFQASWLCFGQIDITDD